MNAPNLFDETEVLRTQNVHFSSMSSCWTTPDDVFFDLDHEFHFTLDACATHENAKCEHYFKEADDALTREWSGSVFCNPPYGRVIGHWIRKGYAEALAGATVVMLVPARTDTVWWHDYCMRGEIRFIRGRLKFGGAKYNAPFPSAVVIFKGSE